MTTKSPGETARKVASLPRIGKTEWVTPDYSPGKRIPWWSKMGSKLVLARLPVPYAIWRSLGIFKHGRSDERWTRERTFATQCLELAARHLGRMPKATLELGPGDSFVGAIVSFAHGVERISIVDVGDFATVDVQRYRPLLEDLEKNFPGVSQRVDLSSRSALLQSMNASYLTKGLVDMATMSQGSIELAFSLKVMEHVRRSEFAALIEELARVAAARSVQRHVVDLHDHMGCSLNSLRFTSSFWENKVVSKSGFYTNRLRCSEIASLAQQAGFHVEIPHALIWPKVPVAKQKMQADFQKFSDEDLQVCMFDMNLSKPTQVLGP